MATYGCVAGAVDDDPYTSDKYDPINEYTGNNQLMRIRELIRSCTSQLRLCQQTITVTIGKCDEDCNQA